MVEVEFKAVSGSFTNRPIFHNSLNSGIGLSSARRLNIYLVFYDFIGGTGFGSISTLETTGNPILDLNKKYTLTLTYNGNKTDPNCAKLYINGVLAPQVPTNTVTENMEFNTAYGLLKMRLSNTVAGLDFSFTRATAWDVELDVADIESCNFDCNETDKVLDILATEGNEAIVYNLLDGGNNGAIANATLSAVWGTPSDVLNPHNEIRGFSLHQNDSAPDIYIRVPYRNDGTPNTPTISGYTFVSNNPAGAWFNDSESKFKFEDESISNSYLASGSGVAKVNQNYVQGTPYGSLTATYVGVTDPTVSMSLYPSIMWFIHNTGFTNSANSYYVNWNYGSATPPLTGWQLYWEFPLGVSPAPTLSFVPGEASDMINADTDELFFNHVTGVAKWFGLNDVYSSNRGYWYLNVLDSKVKKQFTIYKTDKVTKQDVEVLRWHKMGSRIKRDGSGAVVFDGDGHAVLEE